MKTTDKIYYTELTPAYFEQVISLGNNVHGDGYLTADKLTDWATKGLSNGINCGFVALCTDNQCEQLVGFRITFAINNWHIDQWCSPDLWQVASDKACYFKCNTVDERYRGHGIGGKLLKLSIVACKKQGAQAGVAHLWQQSPNNSAVGYFSKCGGQLIKVHADKWHEESLNGYNCVLCGYDCHCSAQEMIIYFD